MVRGIFVTVVGLAFSTAGCGSDDGESDPSSAGHGGTGGSGAAGGTSGTSGGASNCDGAFAVVPAPYNPNTSLEDWGGFAVDDRGAVFSAIPDSELEDASGLPSVIMASDLDGNVTTLYTSDGSSLYGNLILHGDSVYMLDGPIFPSIVRMDRSGGEPVEVVEDTVFAGPVPGGDWIYYATGGTSDVGIYRLDPDTSESTLLVARESEVAALDLDGDTLYWIESDGLLEETDYRLFSMPAEGGMPEMLQSLPRAELALGSFRVVDGVLFGSEITEDIDFVVTRTPIGEEPEIVEDLGGLPLVIGDGFAYYGSFRGGVTKAPLSFASKTTITGSEGRAIHSLALGPDDLWYSEYSCVFRTTK